MAYHRIGKGGGKYKGKAGAGILFTDGKQILLLKRAAGGDNPHTWGIPGGGSKNGESIIHNATRETQEECGLESIPGVRADSLESKDGHHRWTTFLYKVAQPFDVRLSNEHSDWSWVAIPDLPGRDDLHPKFKAELPRLLGVIRKKFTNGFEEWRRICESQEKLSATPGNEADDE